MSNTPSGKGKLEELKRRGCLNRKPQDVRDELFSERGFFDPNDLLQVKYEMVRAIRVDGRPVTHAARAFGFSRPATYSAVAAFEQGGIPALLPKKTGPRRAHKLDGEVLEFVLGAIEENAKLRAPELVSLVAKQFEISVHPRSIERAMERHKKKR